MASCRCYSWPVMYVELLEGLWLTLYVMELVAGSIYLSKQHFSLIGQDRIQFQFLCEILKAVVICAV